MFKESVILNSGAQMWKRSVPAVPSVSHKCVLRAEGFFTLPLELSCQNNE